MMRTLAALAVAALASAPLGAAAQMPKPKPTPAIHVTQTAIRKAQQQQHHAQAAVKANPRQHVATGGAHSDSEVPNNPGETSSKASSGPGYAAGPPKP